MKRFSFLLKYLVRPRILPIILSFLIIGLMYYFFLEQLKQPKYVFIKDDWGVAQNKILNQIKPNSLSVVALGGSTMREAVYPKEIIEKKTIQPTGFNYDFWNLSTSSQTLSESLAILSSLQLKPNSIILINVSLVRFRVTKQDLIEEYKKPRMPFLDYSEVKKFLKSIQISPPKVYKIKQYTLWVQKILDIVKEQQSKEHVALSHHTWFPYSLDYLKKFFVTGISGNYYQYFYQFEDYYTRKIPKKNMPAIEKKQYLTRLELHVLSEFFDNKDINLALLKYICKYATEKGYRVILLELPQDKLASQIDKRLTTAFEIGLKSIDMKGVSLADYSTVSGFNSDDFYDLYHFMDSGRAKFAPKFNELIKNTMEENK